MKPEQRNGFTLIELSIVLVVIGLLIGGVLVGQDLTRAAEVRAQISQIEKFNTAVNTFRMKYDAIPGDMNVVTAQQFGFTVGTNCTGIIGARDGNGLIDGYIGEPLAQGGGETALFWQDLTIPGLTSFVEGTFPNSGGQIITCSGDSYANLSGTTIGEYFPVAKIGRGNYVYVYENNGMNYYGLSAVSANVIFGVISSNANIPVLQAYNIDKKVDDGLPTAGNVQAVYVNNSVSTTANAPHAASDSAATCYNTTSNTYSIGYQGGVNPNCALSLAFQ